MDNFKSIAPNFKEEEFECPCGCREKRMSIDFIKKLQQARTFADIPFVILSGARCPKHNKEVGGKKDSTHVPEYMPDERSHAVDIRFTSGRACWIITTALINAGFTRIGINDGGIHVDDAEQFSFKDGRVLWNYY